MTDQSVKFLNTVNGVTLAPDQVIDGTSGAIVASTEEWPDRPVVARERAPIDISWYEEQRIKLRAQEAHVSRMNESLAMGWYKVIRRSLADLPIQKGGRNILNPDYGANLNAIATAIGVAPRTLSNYRSAMSKVDNEAHFIRLAKGMTWSQLVWALNMSSSTRHSRDRIVPAVDGNPDSELAPALPPVKRRCLVQVPTQLTDFLMENGLEAPDVTAVVVSYLRQPKVRRELLKLFRLSAERTA